MKELAHRRLATNRLNWGKMPENLEVFKSGVLTKR
jgi:hypothetical protein